MGQEELADASSRFEADPHISILQSWLSRFMKRAHLLVTSLPAPHLLICFPSWKLPSCL